MQFQGKYYTKECIDFKIKRTDFCIFTDTGNISRECTTVNKSLYIAQVCAQVLHK